MNKQVEATKNSGLEYTDLFTLKSSFFNQENIKLFHIVITVKYSHKRGRNEIFFNQIKAESFKNSYISMFILHLRYSDRLIETQGTPTGRPVSRFQIYHTVFISGRSLHLVTEMDPLKHKLCSCHDIDSIFK